MLLRKFNLHKLLSSGKGSQFYLLHISKSSTCLTEFSPVSSLRKKGSHSNDDDSMGECATDCLSPRYLYRERGAT